MDAADNIFVVGTTTSTNGIATAGTHQTTLGGFFDGFLANLPSVVVQPLGEEGLLLLGGWSPRCFGRTDLLWVEGWARRLTDELAPVPGEAVPASAPDPSASAPESG